jgi:hypothetical protein
MRTLACLFVIAMVVLAAADPAAAQDRTMNCRPSLERGRIWVECCNQSFTRHPTRAMPWRVRLRSIERCVRNRLRH